MKSERHTHVTHEDKFVKAVNKSTGEVKYTFKASHMAKELGCSHVLVIKALRGDIQTAKGWRVQYLPRTSSEFENAKNTIKVGPTRG